MKRLEWPYETAQRIARATQQVDNAFRDIDILIAECKETRAKRHAKLLKRSEA